MAQIISQTSEPNIVRLTGLAANMKGANKLSAKQLTNMAATAQDFEAQFLSEMMKPMFDSVDVDPTFGGGKTEEVFRDMIVQEYGKSMAQKGGIGLAQHVMEQMIALQSGTSQEAGPATNPTTVKPNLTSNVLSIEGDMK